MISYLQIDKLTKSFGDLVLFEDITFGVAQGQKIGLIAKNGTGKTTLLNIIGGKEDYDSGEVVFRIGDTVKVRLNRSRIEGFSVRELNALLEFDRVFETVFAHVVAFGENIDKLHVFVKSKEAFIEGLGYVLRQRITRIIRIERGEGRVDGNCQIFGGNGLSGQSSCTDERKREGSILFSIHRSSSLAFI